jgi:outer membrane immunogenic protein
MKKLFLGSMALAAVIAGPAMAADMPVKVKAPPPVVLYDWSGVYMGFGVGYNWQHFDWAFDPGIPGAINQSWSFDNDSWIVSGYGGVQAQFGQFVLGAEVSYNKTSSRWASHLGFGTNFATTAEAKVHELFTAGGRFGWTPVDKWLLYVGGGYAAGLVETRQISLATGLELLGAHTNQWQHGWYAGGGLDYMIHKGALVDVVFGIDYKHVDLDTGTHCFASGACNATDINRHNVDAKMDIIQARLTVKTQGWGWAGPWPGPVAAKY